MTIYLLKTIFHHDFAGYAVAVHGVAQIHQGLESIFNHCRIAANHKARIGLSELEADFFFQAAILRQFGNPFAAQCAFRFLARGNRNKSEFMEIFFNQRMLFQIGKALVENQLVGIRDGMRQNQTVETLPDFRLLDNGEERRCANS